MFLEMTLTELRDIAKAGKTAEHNIKIGNMFLIKKANKDDAYIATIAAIGNDYITCATQIQIDFRYYNIPPINDFFRDAEVGYPNSDFKKSINQWFKEQSNEFKSVTKYTVRNYEIHLLTADWIPKERKIHYTQFFSRFETLLEKVFVPNFKEMNYLFKLNFYDGFTSTPAQFSLHAHDNFECNSGRFYRYPLLYGSDNCYYGNLQENISTILFRIG